MLYAGCVRPSCLATFHGPRRFREVGIGAGWVVDGGAAAGRGAVGPAGASVTEVAARIGVSRVSVHGWLGRYLAGVVMVGGQKLALGRVHRHQPITIHVSETTLAIELDDGETRSMRRTPRCRCATSKPTGPATPSRDEPAEAPTPSQA